MSEYSHESVMAHIRQICVYNLSKDGIDSDYKKRELFELLANEPIPISGDFLEKALALGDAEIGFVKIMTPTFHYDNPKPDFPGLSLQGIKRYIRAYIRYGVVSAVHKVLPRLIKIESQTRAFVITKPDGISPSEKH